MTLPLRRFCFFRCSASGFGVSRLPFATTTIDIGIPLPRLFLEHSLELTLDFESEIRRNRHGNSNVARRSTIPLQPRLERVERSARV